MGSNITSCGPLHGATQGTSIASLGHAYQSAKWHSPRAFPSRQVLRLPLHTGVLPECWPLRRNSGDLPMWGFGSMAGPLPTHSLGGIFDHQRELSSLGSSEKLLSQNRFVV